ncbi:hypothetical protein ACTXKP_16350 [Pseudomonas lundensis]
MPPDSFNAQMGLFLYRAIAQLRYVAHGFEQVFALFLNPFADDLDRSSLPINEPVHA